MRENVSPDARLVSDVTLYLNHDSLLEDHGRVRIEDYKLDYSLGGKLITFAKTMIEHHLAYDINLKKNLHTIDSPVIYIPDLRVISDDEVTALTEFVRGGGKLVVSAESGTVKPEGGYRSDFALAELLGVHYEGKTDKDIVYLNATELGKPYFGGWDEGYPVAVNAYGTLVHADEDVEVLATLALPLSRSTDEDVFSSAISNPPWDYTAYPAITRKRLGLGEAIYVAAPLENGKQDMQKRLLAGLVAPEKRRISVKAPSWLEVLVYDDAEGSRYLVNCFNTMEHYYEATAGDVEVTFTASRPVTSVRDAETDAPLPFTTNGETVTVSVGTVTGFKMVIAE